jgi:hypothetical protein
MIVLFVREKKNQIKVKRLGLRVAVNRSLYEHGSKVMRVNGHPTNTLSPSRFWGMDRSQPTDHAGAAAVCVDCCDIG